VRLLDDTFHRYLSDSMTQNLLLSRPNTSVCAQAAARIVGKRKSVVADLNFHGVFVQVPPRGVFGQGLFCIRAGRIDHGRSRGFLTCLRPSIDPRLDEIVQQNRPCVQGRANPGNVRVKAEDEVEAGVCTWK